MLRKVAVNSFFSLSNADSRQLDPFFSTCPQKQEQQRKGHRMLYVLVMMYVCSLFHTPARILIQRFEIFSTCFIQDVGSQRAKLQFQVKNNSLLARVQTTRSLNMRLHTPPVTVKSVSFYMLVNIFCIFSKRHF